MRNYILRLTIGLWCTSLNLTALSAQTFPQSRGAESFASENAILDTSVLFAIGAREARQALRGSFGWPTFQEGLVEGAYFRFDPDGYARFSPSPRLDSDVFEVICRPRTYSCMGRKGGLSMMLTDRGQLQLKFEDVIADDHFFVASGVSEIQVPDRILQPLDHQFEALLATGGELIVRRGGNEVSKVSLDGFNPVATYLRWVLSRQDYTVLPRGWPVPNSRGENTKSDVTNVANWNSPMPQPQVLAPDTFTPNSASGVGGGSSGSDVADVREELKFLRELLLDRSVQTDGVFPADTAVGIKNGSTLTDGAGSAGARRLEELEAAAHEIRTEIARIQGDAFSTDGMQNWLTPDSSAILLDAGNVPTRDVRNQSGSMTATSHSDSETVFEQDLPKKLMYLIEEIGLAPETALAVLQAGSATPPAQLEKNKPDLNTVVSDLSQSDVVSEILKELEGDLGRAGHNRVAEAGGDGIETDRTVSQSDYQLLSNYFKSVVFPELAQNH